MIMTHCGTRTFPWETTSHTECHYVNLTGSHEDNQMLQTEIGQPYMPPRWPQFKSDVFKSSFSEAEYNKSNYQSIMR